MADPKVTEGALLMVPTRVVEVKDIGNILLEVRGGATGTTKRFTLAAADLERDAIPTATILDAVYGAKDREAEIEKLKQYAAGVDAENGLLRAEVAGLRAAVPAPATAADVAPVPGQQPIVVEEPKAPEPMKKAKLAKG